MEHGVSFNGTELALISGILGGVIGALSLLFRLLMGSKDQVIAAWQAAYERERDLVDRLEPPLQRTTQSLETLTRTVDQLVTEARRRA